MALLIRNAARKCNKFGTRQFSMSQTVGKYAKRYIPKFDQFENKLRQSSLGQKYLKTVPTASAIGAGVGVVYGGWEMMERKVKPGSKSITDGLFHFISGAVIGVPMGAIAGAAYPVTITAMVTKSLMSENVN